MAVDLTVAFSTHCIPGIRTVSCSGQFLFDETEFIYPLLTLFFSAVISSPIPYEGPTTYFGSELSMAHDLRVLAAILGVCTELERMAGRVINICERTVFIETGKMAVQFD